MPRIETMFIHDPSGSAIHWEKYKEVSWQTDAIAQTTKFSIREPSVLWRAGGDYLLNGKQLDRQEGERVALQIAQAEKSDWVAIKQMEKDAANWNINVVYTPSLHAAQNTAIMWSRGWQDRLIGLFRGDQLIGGADAGRKLKSDGVEAEFNSRAANYAYRKMIRESALLKSGEQPYTYSVSVKIENTTDDDVLRGLNSVARDTALLFSAVLSATERADRSPEIVDAYRKALELQQAVIDHLQTMKNGKG